MRSQVSRNPASATTIRNLRKLLFAAMEEAAEKDLTGLGARIREARMAAGLTQDELSDLVGVGMRQIQYYESGDSNPYRTLRRIAEATDRSVGWFLRGDAPTELSADELIERLEHVESGQERVEAALAEQRALLDELLRRAPKEQRARKAAG
jgi:transcriptional regulator with XRE-family HTH domain